LEAEREIHTSLSKLFRQFGFPKALIPDHAKSLTQGDFRKTANKVQVPIFPLEPYQPNQNLAEDTIREATRMYRRFMHARGIPKGFWDRVFCYYLELRSHLALGHHLQEGECGTTIVTGETADISHLVDFSIFDWCWALSPRQSTQDAKQLCRWLGPSFTVGGALCFAVTTASAQVLHRSSVIPLKIEERNSDDIKRLKNDFMDCLKDNLRKKAEGISLRPEDILDLEKKFGIEPKPLEAEEIPYFDPYEDHTFDQPEHSGRDEFDDVFEEPPQ